MTLMNPTLTKEQLDELRRFTSPTIANAIETFDMRGWDEGFMDSSIKCVFPDLGAIIGYAVTATIMSGQIPAEKRLVDRRDYWRYVQEAPGPKLAVMQDLTQPALGAYWGEVNSNIHRALGCTGVITSGAVRDLDEMRTLGFYTFSGSIAVSHAFAHLEDFNRPVRLGGLLVRPGDLLHADRHGVVVIPVEVADRVADAAREVERGERVIIDICKSPDFSIDKIHPLVSPAY